MDDVEKSFWKKSLNIFIRVCIPVLFFYYAFQVIKPEDVFFAFQKANWLWFSAGSACILVLNCLCATRTRLLLNDKESSVFKLCAVHTLSSLIAGVLPFRTGELSFVYYLRKYCSASATEGMAILVSVRVIEYLVFLLFILILSVFGIYLETSKLSICIFSIIGANLLLVILIIWNAPFFSRLLKSVLKNGLGFLFKRANTDSIFTKIEGFSYNIKKTFSEGVSKKILFLTAWIVILRQVFILAMLLSMGIRISLWLVVLLFAFLYAAKFIQGFGSFGTQEAGISAALILIGYTQAEALPIAIGTHLLQWAPILFLGSLSYLVLRFDIDRRLV